MTAHAEAPIVTIIIPAWNESTDIAGCIDAVAAQSIQQRYMEVLVVDGGSTDATAEMSHSALSANGLNGTVITNPQRRTSTSLNAGLELARGRIVVRLDARARIPTHYVEHMVNALDNDSGIGVVGGAQVAQARGDASVIERGIARALRNRYATGLSRYRLRGSSGPSDTVWMGAFRRADLLMLGGWDPDTALNEDYELNERYRANGYQVWFDAECASSYLPRQSYAQLARQYFRFGRVKGMWWARGRRPSKRQVALVLLPPTMTIGAYAVCRRTSVRTVIAGSTVAVFLLDRLGSDDGAPVAERTAAVAGIGVLSSCWWIGVLAGFIGEILGCGHDLA